MFGGLIPRPSAATRWELDPLDPINRAVSLFWPLSASGGKHATDLSPYRRYATLYNGAVYSASGVAVSSNAYMEAAYSSRLDWTGGKWFVSLWITGLYASQVTYGNLFTSNGTGLYREAATGKLALYLAGVTNYDFGAGTYSEIFSGVRNHVAVTQNGTAAMLYLNGRLRSTIAVAGAPTNPAGIVRVGTDTTGTYPTTGVYQNIRVGLRVLQPSEAQRLYRDPWAGVIDPAARLFFAVRSIAPTTNTGTVSSTLAAATLASTATVALKGTTSATLAAATLSATGTVSLTGTASATLAATTVVATGTLPLVGTVSATLGNATSAATGTVALTGALAVTLDAATLVATGTSANVNTGTLSSTLDAATLSAAATLALRASTTTTLANATLSGTGTLQLRATSSVTLGNVALSATGTNGNVVNAIVLVWNGVRI